jgi:hypothetical protein
LEGGLNVNTSSQLADPSFYLGIKKKKGGEVNQVRWIVLRNFMNLKEISEPCFTKILVKDLEKRGIRVIDLGAGTFDLAIEGRRRRIYFIELKKVKPDYSTHQTEKGFDFTRPQHKEIEKMQFPPIVIGFDSGGCYWFNPKRVKKEVTERHGYFKNGQAARFRTPYFGELKKPMKYDALVNKLVKKIEGTR